MTETFNRTIMELKHAITMFLIDADTTFNRTIMELKQSFRDTFVCISS